MTYPINAVSSVFWIAIPPWICIGGAFPFRFNPTFAILGSLMLRLIEWAIVMRAKREAVRAGTALKRNAGDPNRRKLGAHLNIHYPSFKEPKPKKESRRPSASPSPSAPRGILPA